MGTLKTAPVIAVTGATPKDNKPISFTAEVTMKPVGLSLTSCRRKGSCGLVTVLLPNGKLAMVGPTKDVEGGAAITCADVLDGSTVSFVAVETTGSKVMFKAR